MFEKLASGAAFVALIATIAVASGPAEAAGGCTSPAGPAVCASSAAAPFVTPAQAKAAVVALWNTRERANLRRDATALAQLDTGTETLADHYALSGLTCGCWKWYWTKAPRTIHDVQIYYPRQDHYPLYLLAQVTASTTGQTVASNAALADFVVTRDSAEAPWRFAMQLWDDGYVSTRSPGFYPPPLDPEGYDVMPRPLTAGAQRWPSELAAYYTHLKVYGTPPASPRFVAGPLTTGTDLTKRRQDFRAYGLQSHYAFVVGGRPWLFTMFNGETLSCADVIETQTRTPLKPHTVFVQNDGPGQAWGPDLDTGYYSKLVTTYDWPVCIGETSAGLQVIGPTSGSVTIHDGGIPAKLLPGMTGLA